MKTFLKGFAIIVAVLILAFGAFSVYVYVTGGSAEPTREVAAERIQPAESLSIVYQAVPGDSEARFIIDEVLRGLDTTVVGVTDQLDGSVAVGFEPPGVEIGPFEINLRAIRTDDEMRDRTIRSMILETNRDEFEFSSFRPTVVQGVPDSISVGSRLELEVTGALTIRDVTREVPFTMVLEIVSEEEIRGLARANVLYRDFGIEVPYVGGSSIVQAVADTVRLELEFVARP